MSDDRDDFPAGNPAAAVMADRIGATLLRHIPRHAARVVEIGGGDALPERHARYNPGCRFLRIAEGGEALDADALLARAGGPIDCLIYRGTLEFLDEPAALLRRQAEALGPDGVVLALMPNVQHWTVLRDLLGGTWRAAARDLRGRAQRRFFTGDAMAALAREAGLVVYDAKPVAGEDRGFAEFAASLAPSLAHLAIDPHRFASLAGASHFLLRVARRARRRLLVHAVRLRSGRGTEVRIAEPLAFLDTLPHLRSVTDIDVTSTVPAIPEEDRVIVFQRRRFHRPRDLPGLADLIATGYLLINEFDDHPSVFPDIAANGYLSFRGVHAVQVSTPALAALVRTHNPNVAVFANAVAELPPPRAPRAGPVTLFFGALNREQDWPAIMPALNRVLERHGARVRVEVIHDRLFFEALTTPHKRFTPLCAHVEYKRLLAASDIALMPLADTEFNRTKSDLKFIEAAALGAVALASPVVYAETLRDGETGVLFRDAHEFEARLDWLTRDGAARARIARAAYEYVAAERLLCRQFTARGDWYAGLIADRARLQAELAARVPEMAGA